MATNHPGRPITAPHPRPAIPSQQHRASFGTQRDQNAIRAVRGQISLARVAVALGAAAVGEQFRVGFHRLIQEAERLAPASATFCLVASELSALSPRVFRRQELEVAQAEIAVQVGGCPPAIAAVLEPPPPFLSAVEEGVWRDRRLRVYVRAILRGEAVSPSLAYGLQHLGGRSEASIRAATTLSGSAPAIAALASRCASWLRPVARAFHTAAVEELHIRTRPVEGSVQSSAAQRTRKYRPLARLKPLIVRLRGMRRVGLLEHASFTLPEPQWNALAARVPADLHDPTRATYACALYFTCRFQIAPRDFDCIRLGPWRADGESWLDLTAAAGHLSLDLVGLTGTPSRWPPELKHRAVLLIPVNGTVLDCLRKLLDANPGARDLAELLVSSAAWMGDFERYLHSLAISSWQVTIERLTSAFPEHVAARLGNEVGVDAALALGGLCSRSLYHYLEVRAIRLQRAARDIDRLLGF